MVAIEPLFRSLLQAVTLLPNRPILLTITAGSSPKRVRLARDIAFLAHSALSRQLDGPAGADPHDPSTARVRLYLTDESNVDTRVETLSVANVIHIISSPRVIELSSGVPDAIRFRLRLSWVPSWLISAFSAIRSWSGVGVEPNTFHLSALQLRDAGFGN